MQYYNIIMDYDDNSVQFHEEKIFTLALLAATQLPQIQFFNFFFNNSLNIKAALAVVLFILKKTKNHERYISITTTTSTITSIAIIHRKRI